MTNPVVYNGATNSFSGVGTPNPKLNIPQKDKMEPAVLAMALAIEQWCNNVTAVSGPPGPPGGTYASLIGPGQTETPGALSQYGELDVTGPFTVLDTDGLVVTSIVSSLGITVNASGSGAQLNVEATGGGAATVALTGTRVLLHALSTGVQIQAQGGGSSGDIVSLFSYYGDPNGSVTSLNMGDLCVDVGTPGLWQANGTGTAWTRIS